MMEWGGWLGESHLWIKAFHIIFVIFWMAGLLLLPRYYIYHRDTVPGSPEDQAWIAREKRLLRIIINPAMILTWLLGLMLAVNLGMQGGWLHAKITLVLALSGYHGWMAGLRKKFARGERPLSSKALRIANEVPSIAVIIIVILAVVRPF